MRSVDISSNSFADDVPFGLEPTDTRLKPMPFQTQKCSQCQPDVVALSAGFARRTSFHSGELFEPPMVVLDPPGLLCVIDARQLVHVQVVGNPVPRAAVFSNDPERLDRPETFDVNDRPSRCDRHFADRAVAGAVRIDPAVATDLSQEMSVVGSDCFEVVLAGIPEVETDVAGANPRAFAVASIWRKKSFLFRAGSWVFSTRR